MTREQILERLRVIIEEEAVALRDELRSLTEAEELTDEQQSRFDELTGDESPIDTLASERANLERRLSVVDASQRLTEPGEHRAPAPTHRDDPWDPADLRVAVGGADQVRGRVFRAIEGDTTLSDQEKHAVTSLVERVDRNGELARHILATGSPKYRSAWAKTISGHPELMDEAERQAMDVARAQSLTTTQGGFAVPAFLDTTVLLTNDGRVHPLRQISRIEQITSNKWHGISTDGVTAAYEAEATQVGESTMEIARPEIEVEKAQVFAKASIEITQDWTALASELARVFADARDDLEATKFTVGQGSASNEPGGVVFEVGAVTSSRVTASTNGEYNVTDVYATQEALPPRYQDNAQWMANLAIINRTREFGTQVGHAFLTELSAGQPRQLLGQALHQNSVMASQVAQTTSTNTDILLYGDFNRFLIVDRVGMSVEFIPHVFGANQRPTGERGFYAYWRNSSGVVDTNAFRVLRSLGA